MMRSLAIRHQVMMEPPPVNMDKLQSGCGENRKRRKRLLQFRRESTDFSSGQHHQHCYTGEKPSTRRLPYKFTPLKHI